jgi:hypothetical protein
MRALGFAVLLCAAACAKKPAARAPAPAATAAPDAAPAPQDDGKGSTPPASQAAPRAGGDPCSGGERPH